MKAFVGVTDNDWFRFLAARPGIDEVNFWQPSGRQQFRALSAGQPFLFKLHAPHNFIVGGGFFAHFSLLPHGLAWEFFREKNGAATFAEMEKRIVKYRRVAPSANQDFTIGCILLAEPFFFERSDWIPVPSDWKPNIVQGKTYDLATGLGKELWKEVRLRLEGSVVRDVGRVGIEGPLDAPIWSEPTLVRRRLGQGTFKSCVTDAYQRRCAVTQEKALPVLDAAHIRAVADGGRHLIENGLLLRTDIHRLFDAGYVTVDDQYRFRVSRKLKDDYDNGEPYYPFDRQEIWLPGQTDLRPSREFLEWHSDTRFRG